MVHKAWKGIWKEWEFCSSLLIDNGNVQLDKGNYVDGTFCMDDGIMLLGGFLKGKIYKIYEHIYSINTWSNA